MDNTNSYFLRGEDMEQRRRRKPTGTQETNDPGFKNNMVKVKYAVNDLIAEAEMTQQKLGQYLFNPDFFLISVNEEKKSFRRYKKK